VKKNILILALIFCSAAVWAQGNIITVSGGYAFANIEDSNVQGTGFRINAIYEYYPAGALFAHGVTLGYAHLSSSETVLQQEVKSVINSFPIYYSPKVIFGGEKIKFFIKGALGMQYAGLTREAEVTITDYDFGFYGGGGAGIMIFLKENIFINGEYEIAWSSNHSYKEGWLNSATGGIGVKF
jgi:hypothetical protein